MPSSNQKIVDFRAVSTVEVSYRASHEMISVLGKLAGAILKDSGMDRISLVQMMIVMFMRIDRILRYMCRFAFGLLYD